MKKHSKIKGKSSKSTRKPQIFRLRRANSPKKRLNTMISTIKFAARRAAIFFELSLGTSKSKKKTLVDNTIGV